MEVIGLEIGDWRMGIERGIRDLNGKYSLIYRKALAFCSKNDWYDILQNVLCTIHSSNERTRAHVWLPLQSIVVQSDSDNALLSCKIPLLYSYDWI
jgi:hypothetical protein